MHLKVKKTKDNIFLLISKFKPLLRRLNIVNLKVKCQKRLSENTFVTHYLNDTNGRIFYSVSLEFAFYWHRTLKLIRFFKSDYFTHFEIKNLEQSNSLNQT